MITNNEEFYSSPYYFFIKETKNKYSLYFSIEGTLLEARKKDEMISVPKDKIEGVKKYLENIVKDKKKKTTKKVKSEIEELVNADGGISNSKIPILDPKMHPKKTMDQTISMARITNDPITRGYRTYFGESEMTENDMSDAFGWKETKDLDGKETFKFFVNNLDMEPDEAKDRTEQQGKDPSGKRDEKSKYRYKRVKTKNGKIKKVKDPNFISRQILPEIQKQKAIKVLEDILMNKTSDDKEVGKKELNSSKILTKNVSALKKQAEKEGISLSELIKMLKGE
jgi:hypothetical protein